MKDFNNIKYLKGEVFYLEYKTVPKQYDSNSILDKKMFCNSPLWHLPVAMDPQIKSWHIEPVGPVNASEPCKPFAQFTCQSVSCPF